jgi:hypothetical protein
MEQLTNIIIKYLKHKSNKEEAAENKKYDIAARERDSEIKVGIYFYNLMNGLVVEDQEKSEYEFTIWNTHDLVDLDIRENFIKNWILKELNIDIDIIGSAKSIILINRMNNLDYLLND